MCLLCDDEKAYAAYMDYLDAMERQGKAADSGQALDAVLADIVNSNNNSPAVKPSGKKSPFSCDPVDE